MLLVILMVGVGQPVLADHLFELQSQAIEDGHAEFGHWGWDADVYTRWGTHSNRLVPVYTYGTRSAAPGIDLDHYTADNSVYRSARRLEELYGRVPEQTLNPHADYLDQTDLSLIQKAALEAGKKQIILFVFDGMDWQTTQAASIAKLNRIAYTAGRGTGLHFQDYDAHGTSQFAAMVTSPYVDDMRVDVDEQSVSGVDDSPHGGYSAEAGGAQPWSEPTHPEYLLTRKTDCGLLHAYTDSASSATSMTAGIKTFNAAINIDVQGQQVTTIAHQAQARGYRIGIVTSVPISHATPAAAYAHNVSRNDYQDLTNDLLGERSISHPDTPLPGVDVLLGAGFGEKRNADNGQGANFVPGNPYLTEASLRSIDHRNGGRYVVALRESGVSGSEALASHAQTAVHKHKRLFGFYGVDGGHLPFQTADGDYRPAVGRKKTAEAYSPTDIAENPTLAEMTAAALAVLEQSETGFWMLVEAGDVDWANHDNNLDNSIGAVLSGDAAVRVVTDWVEKHSSWDDALLIVTADHGHYLVLEKPELLIAPESYPVNAE